jgi:hypothetical protein
MHNSMRNRLRNVSDLVNKPLPGGGDALLDIAQKLYETLDTPVSLGCSLRLKYREWNQLVRMSISPSDYLQHDWKRFSDDYQAISFLKKYPQKIEGVDRETTAWVKFQEAEEQCRQTNQRFRSYREGRLEISPAVSASLHIAQRKISQWLGSLNVESWLSRCRFGPGSDNLAKGEHVSAYDKFRSGVSATAEFGAGARALVQCHPSWYRGLSGLTSSDFGPAKDVVVDTVPGNTVCFVPKTALTDRSIAIEPQLNIFAQLGLGALLRGRLKRAGLDLDDQSPNQLLARQGSLYGDIVTVDLSSASDTLSIEVVRDLLPEPWFNALDWVRSRYGRYGDKTFRYHKFSSMGNGFTFELESMIFYALALAASEVSGAATGRVRAYGDDIVVEKEAFELLSQVLDFCGFSLNMSKSFSTGVFRESCGADFFNGYNVRPIFQKEFLTDASSYYRLANSIRRVAYRRNLGFGCSGKFRRVWVSVVCRLPVSLRDLKVPPRPVLLGRGKPVLVFHRFNARQGLVPVYEFRHALGEQPWADVESDDGGLMCNLDEALSSPFVSSCRDGWEGWQYVSAITRPRKVDTIRGGAMTWLTALYLGKDGVETATQGMLSLRGGNTRRLNRDGVTPSWFDLGVWTS